MKATGIARRCKVHNAIKNKEQITSKTVNKTYQKHRINIDDKERGR